MELIDLVAKHADAQVATDSDGKFIYWGTWLPVSAEIINLAQIERQELELAAKESEVRAKRARLIESFRWRIERHKDEIDLGLEPTEPLEPLLQYVQDLRDVPQQEGFPETIEWPEIPFEGEI